MQIIPRKNPYQFIGRIMAGTGAIAGLFAAMNADGSGGVWTVAVLGLASLSLLISGTVLILAAREIQTLEAELTDLATEFEALSEGADAMMTALNNPMACDGCGRYVLDEGNEIDYGRKF